MVSGKSDPKAFIAIVMKTLIVTQVHDWLVNHFPDVTAFVFVVGVLVWLTIRINNFGHRFTATEQLCNDIHTRQLPEIRNRLDKIDERLSRIELSLNAIITFLSTTRKNYPKE